MTCTMTHKFLLVARRGSITHLRLPQGRRTVRSEVGRCTADSSCQLQLMDEAAPSMDEAARDGLEPRSGLTWEEDLC
jgi:hypothetical protein